VNTLNLLECSSFDKLINLPGNIRIGLKCYHVVYYVVEKIIVRKMRPVIMQNVSRNSLDKKDTDCGM
jgi:hypothetical protein